MQKQEKARVLYQASVIGLAVAAGNGSQEAADRLVEMTEELGSDEGSTDDWLTNPDAKTDMAQVRVGLGQLKQAGMSLGIKQEAAPNGQ